MENKFVAIEKIKYLEPKPIFRKHTNVIQLNVEDYLRAEAFNKKANEGQRKGQRHPACVSEIRQFKCLDCGATWKESIHSPLIISAADLNYYYPQAVNCKTFK